MFDVDDSLQRPLVPLDIGEGGVALTPQSGRMRYRSIDMQFHVQCNHQRHVAYEAAVNAIVCIPENALVTSLVFLTAVHLAPAFFLCVFR